MRNGRFVLYSWTSSLSKTLKFISRVVEVVGYNTLKLIWLYSCDESNDVRFGLLFYLAFMLVSVDKAKRFASTISVCTSGSVQLKTVLYLSAFTTVFAVTLKLVLNAHDRN